MKINVLLAGLFLTVVSLTSCSSEQASEELNEVDQLEVLTDQNVQAIDKGEITEDDT